MTRTAGPPDTVVVNWDSCGGGGTIDIEPHLVTSGEVRLNDASIFGPPDFKRSVVHLDAGVVLQEGTNELSVEIAGQPGAQLLIRFIPD